MPHIDPIMGIPVHTTTTVPEWVDGELYQWRFPRSKGRRIRKKWAARRRNLRPKRERYCYRLNGVLVMHPRTYYALTGGPEPRVHPIDARYLRGR